MRHWTLSLLMMTVLLPAKAQEQPSFGEFFFDRALRIELFCTGDARNEEVTVGSLIEEPIWPGNPAVLLQPFERGHHKVSVYDSVTKRLIYAAGYDDMLGEYQTTAPAQNGIRRTFERAVRIPMPKRAAFVVLESRDRKNLLHTTAKFQIDPRDVGIIRESPDRGDRIMHPIANGDPHTHVDLVFLAEGYTAAEQAKFESDVNRFVGALFTVEPYASLKQRFNVSTIFRPSVEEGTDEPRQHVFRSTVLQSSFNAFGLDRYLLTEDGFALRRMAAEVPYDAIVVLVNSPRYGGGGIYNDYCITTADHRASLQVFAHEFGHAFAGLADEYYSSDVAYNEFYAPGVEPLEPNITALLDPPNVKWKDLLTPGIPVPTPYGRDLVDSLSARRWSVRDSLGALRRREKDGSGQGSRMRATETEWKREDERLRLQIDSVREAYHWSEPRVGAFEGAGYAARGLYRPMVYCLMISSPTNEFCLVCRRAIARAIDLYSVR